jgi:hypothetical protein
MNRHIHSWSLSKVEYTYCYKCKKYVYITHWNCRDCGEDQVR